MAEHDDYRQLVNIADGLRDVGLQEYISLPRICVVGTQSAGKSSVLESVVGISFLPRGDGVVTRRPLEMRLINVDQRHLADVRSKFRITENVDAWACFGQETIIHTDFEEVRRQITLKTDEVAGARKGIINIPLLLSIWCVHAPDLTIIDLPGITRVPMKGTDQTEDVERITQEMAFQYISDPRTLILAVMPGNQDISTSDALAAARRVDPSGFRTLGVVTKLDLMDHGTNAYKMITGEDIALRLGFIGVLNRSQKDIVENKTIKETREKERKFFSDQECYQQILGSLGTENLIIKLTTIFKNQLVRVLPDIKKDISTRNKQCLAELAKLGEGVPADKSSQLQLVWSHLVFYNDTVCNNLRGRYDYKRRSAAERTEYEVTTAVTINEVYAELLDQQMTTPMTASMTDVDIDRTIRMHEGGNLPGFPSQDTFEYMLMPALTSLHDPISECLEKVYLCIQELVQKSSAKCFKRFPQLQQKVETSALAELEVAYKNADWIVRQVIDAELSYIYTADHKFLSEHGAQKRSSKEEITAAEKEKAKQKASVSSSLNSLWHNSAQVIHSTVTQTEAPAKPKYSETFISEIRQRLDSYYSIVVRNVRDCVPKLIGTFLVRQFEEKLLQRLQIVVYADAHDVNFLEEPSSIAITRQQISNQAAVLKKSLSLLQNQISTLVTEPRNYEVSKSDELLAKKAYKTSLI